MKNDVNIVCYHTLVNFPDREQAINFFRNSINNSKGEEKNRYIYIYMTLTSTNNKLVHDQNPRTDPVFSKIGKFLGTHIEDIEKLPYEMTYKEYSNYKELKNQKDYEL